MELSDFLKKDRKSKDMSQTEYSKDIGISRSTLASLETEGRTPSPANAKKLTKYFKKPLSELLGQEKIDRMSMLETTNLLIDSLINKDLITDCDLNDQVKKLIWESLSLEIALKLKLKDEKEKKEI